ncbi:hypothetical protein CFC21_021180 [Triticum aestivum]|uniref:Bifunctional inhibitor/plant lipid transfer protein/seed storage helical domain-containing protein n=4 Tax=Triticum aestivum TaxID=4565 RepID=A0A9R1J6J4_WHEAT|nr:non-specific lipid transfer protein GPI-anchored 23-like [Triticum aestivum]XP_044319080.1 non-specific lipid transfer protein GPI-anchored 23-like [Triticum aestivum]XP_044319082.1 non-specific lipid transfer protein GPI-anchored 23-like [Triticum aestivum]XP_044319083.1 non-specific lipid transfer protein GPI-anchored 23-like [Triticum aestivum]XP_044319084.1 non-specific lipid transfer protein GPI-anchored 23-like [Triticum aestivum]KAF7006115.1 hypothetical protein CFC21_021180 [Triticu
MAHPKSHLACLFLALALAVLTAAASEPLLSAAVTARAPAPSPNGDLVAKPSAWGWTWCIIPCFSFIPEIFCIPPIFCPRTPQPPPPSPPPPPPLKPQPKECRTPLMGLMPCKDFLTSSTAPEPPNQGKCCDGLRSLVQDAPICLCRILEGTDLDKLMSATVDREKFIRTMIICDSSPGEFGSCEGPVPPMTMRAAPTPKAAP